MNEIYHLLKVITFKKVVNYLKLSLSYFFFFYLGGKKIKGLPFSLSVEPTNLCNLNCLECPTGQNTLTRKKGDIDFSLYNKIIAQNRKTLITLILYFQGEPLINDKIFELINLASKNKIYTITSTNGHYLNVENCKKIVESKLNKLIISLDGINQQTYQEYRVGGNYKTVINGINNLIETKKNLKSKLPIIELQFLVFKHNQHQITDFKILAKKLNVDKYKLKSAQIYDLEKNKYLIPTINKFSRYKKDENGNFIIKSKLKNHCSRMWKSSVITWQGDVVPCCFDKDAKYVLGNINNNDFKIIWKNNNYLKFRESIKTDRQNIDICKNCSEGLIK